MKNVTISLPDDLHQRLRKEASARQMSLNAWLRELLTEHVGSGPEEAAAFHAALVEDIGVAPRSWKWSRAEHYEDAISYGNKTGSAGRDEDKAA